MLLDLYWNSPKRALKGMKGEFQADIGFQSYQLNSRCPLFPFFLLPLPL
jgi:hypothetical protein